MLRPLRIRRTSSGKVISAPIRWTSSGESKYLRWGIYIIFCFITEEFVSISWIEKMSVTLHRIINAFIVLETVLFKVKTN
ncbi:MAG: hypothetical protein METHP_01468 [Methanoregula sp. SKADARSKE-2]|nr:MAG: hypothetical protein METHP_01468 [Methanoregula sp. SKADARSKE-2]